MMASITEKSLQRISSYNIPAVKLLNQVGVNTLIDKAEEINHYLKDRKRFGLSDSRRWRSLYDRHG
jgi:membrane peptidoglycan carboxypeptidase